jgi:hypothetical protein
MVATDDCPEAQVTLLVRFWVLESAKVPVAVNAVDTPSGTLAVTGVTAMDTNAVFSTTTDALLLVIAW